LLLNTVRDPLISFTAVQGLTPWLKKQPVVQQLGLDKVPNQLFLWQIGQMPFQLQAAIPVTDPTNAFQRVAGHWMPQSNRVLEEYAAGEIRSLTNRAELLWRGLPILAPYLRPVREGSRGFLHAGLFPVNLPTNPPPKQLLDELHSATNLLYYDWEITQTRLTELRPLFQLASVFLTISPMSTNSAPSKWLDAIEPRLGNTVTEVNALSARELSIIRTSHSGFSGLELLALANWLESTNFPNLNLNLHFRPIIQSKGNKPPR
jgi:hypothetical protein